MEMEHKEIVDDESVDVCFLLEGTYPYISGGVSSWVHQTVSGLPDVRFGIIFMGISEEHYKKYAYDVPSNVKWVRNQYLFDMDSIKDDPCRKMDKESEPMWSELANKLRVFLLEQDEDYCNFYEFAIFLYENMHKFNYKEFCNNPYVWAVMTEMINRFMPKESFVDIFYTLRSMIYPIWKTIECIKLVPEAKFYHSLCTGYAGVLSALLSYINKKPFLLSEHGIYVKERIGDISQSDWLFEMFQWLTRVDEDLGPLKKMWIEKFRFLGKLAYYEASQITTLFDGNFQIQVAFGAYPKKIMIIPNGINSEKYDTIFDARMSRLQNTQPKVVGFIGRVVQIKDVKTLIRAFSQVVRKVPEAQLEIIGPTDEEKEYYNQCMDIVQVMKLENQIHFRGRQNVMDIIGGLDVMVLTSVSEGLPFVILEAYAAGIPCVATDVGACRELIFGKGDEDRALGKGGILTKVSSPDQTAMGIVELLKDKEKLFAMGKAGKQRAGEFYLEESVLRKYRDQYEELGL